MTKQQLTERELLERMREDHVDFHSRNGVITKCRACLAPWPCDAFILLGLLDTTQQELHRLEEIFDE